MQKRIEDDKQPPRMYSSVSNHESGNRHEASSSRNIKPGKSADELTSSGDNMPQAHEKSPIQASREIKQKYDDDLLDPLFIRITKRLRQIAHELDKHSKYLQEKHYITVPQIITLREIYEHGPISFSELTRIVSLNNSTVTGIVDRLERQKLVQRTRTSKDRRRIDLIITEEGVQFLQNTPPPIQENFVNGLDTMSEEKVETILWSIDTILELLTDRSDHPDPPRSSGLSQ
ncbi:MAG: MarR family transcriptional regulator [Spirochaetales bacterium]|nr:MarR family transcriptional regulator [Spirochaetales bacterium]MCF7938064.1 MarR family transcriptional regulator [Spirochaetales bacterium]